MSSDGRDVDADVSSPLPPPPVAPVAASTPGGISAEEERADEYEETYLKMWNNTTNPKEVSCRTAFDILCWCFGPASQLRSVYRTGATTLCTQQRLDFQLCLKVRATAMKQPEEARVSLRTQIPTRPSFSRFAGGQQETALYRVHLRTGHSRAPCCCGLWLLSILQELLRADRLAKQDPRPHVWKMRTEPPPQFKAWTIGEATNDAQAAAASGKM